MSVYSPLFRVQPPETPARRDLFTLSAFEGNKTSYGLAPVPKLIYTFTPLVGLIIALERSPTRKNGKGPLIRFGRAFDDLTLNSTASKVGHIVEARQ